ncbi:hypothetical protein ACIBI4_22315 [Streptomyces sp. NPDC050418]|uniref:hypothetical protein n=1 Tax=Streptomyces sp. NPDC050418 TaxID=3365612 RepID=UPI0037AB79ED
MPVPRRRRRIAAAAAVGLLLASGTAGAAEPPPPEESSGPSAEGVGGVVEPSVVCQLPAGQGERTGPQKITVRLSPATVAPGGTVHVSVDLGPTPATSPMALEDAPFTAGIEFALAGGADGTVTVFGKRTTIDVPLAPDRIQVPSYEGDFMMPTDARGPVSLIPTRTLTVTRVLDRDHETACAARSGTKSVGSVDVEGAARPAPTLATADRAVSPGATVPVEGARWTPDARPRALLCAEDGTRCSPARFAESSLDVDAEGRLRGALTLAGPELVGPGEHRLRVFDGSREAGTSLTVTVGESPSWPSPSPSGSPSPSHLTPADPAAQPGGDVPGEVEASPRPGESPDGARLTRSQQRPATYVTPGPLSMKQSGKAVNFGAFELGEQATATSSLNTVTVSDGRGHNIGWSLTATLTDLRTSHGGVIPASAVTWTPVCVAEPGSVGRPTAGSPGALGSRASSLCTMGSQLRTPFTGGEFRADASLSLSVPGFVPPGEYKATLQLTLL